MEWFHDNIKTIDGFPWPEWDKIWDYFESNFSENEYHDISCQIAREWCGEIAKSLPSNYAVHESDNFILVSDQDQRTVEIYLEYLEKVLKRVLHTLNGIASDEGYGKHVALMFHSKDSYYDYIFHLFPEDKESSGSSGIYINRGYGHFAFPLFDITASESVTVHEMTHALVSHLPLPLWLNEGLATGVENLLTRGSPIAVTPEAFGYHQEHWNEENIQDFWVGLSFSQGGDATDLSYHMSQYLVSQLSQDYETFKIFANKADYKDAGNAAAQEVYGVTLDRLFDTLLGEGNWTPNPDAWDAK